MMKITLLTLLFSFHIFATDSSLLLLTSKDAQLIDTLNNEKAKAIADFSIRINKHEQEYSAKRAALAERGHFVRSIGGSIPFFGSFINEVYNKWHENLFSHAYDVDSESFYTKEIDASLSEMALKKKVKMISILKIEDPIIRTEKMWDEFKDNAIFNHLHASMNDREFKAFSVIAIKELAARTAVLAGFIVENTKKIDELASQYDQLKSQVEQRTDQVKEKAENDANLQETAIKIQEECKKLASRTPGSLASSESTEENSQLLVTIANKMEEYSGYLATSYKIATNFGLKGKDAERMGQAIQYVQIGAKIAKAVANPTDVASILDAVLSVSSLFGKKQPDIAQQRHEQIMKAFSSVFENQNKIMENQRIILEAVKQLHKKIDELYKQSFKWNYAISDKFDTVLGNQAAMMEAIIITSNGERRRRSCKEFFNSRFKCDWKNLVDIGADLPYCVESINKGDQSFVPGDINLLTNPILITGYFKDFESMADHFFKNNNYNHYTDCKKEIDSVFGGANQDLLFAKFYANDYVTMYESTIKPVLIPLINIVEQYYSNRSVSIYDHDQSLNKFILSLTTSDNELAWKTARYRTFRQAFDIDRFMTKKATIHTLKNLYYVPALKEDVNYLLELIPYQDTLERKHLWSAELVFKDPINLMKTFEEDSSDEVIDYINKAYEFVSIAIMQQAILSGDQILHLIDTVIKDPNHKFYFDIIRALSLNRTLRNNYLVYHLHNLMRHARPTNTDQSNLEFNLAMYTDFWNNGHQICSYDFEKKAYVEGCESEFIRKLHTPLRLVSKAVRFETPHGMIDLPLPSPDEIRDHIFHYTPQMIELQELRKQIIERALLNKGAYEKITDSIPLF